MRKNYFAKKFVAYSMAFAVAFSTLTVSPMFVKDAKADYSLITSEESLTQFNDSGFVVEDGALLVKKITKDVNTTLTQSKNALTSAKLVDGLGVKAVYAGVSLTETTDIANSTAKKVEFENETNALTVSSVSSRTDSYQLLNTDMSGTKIAKSADVPVQIDGTKNVDFKIKGSETPVAGVWYKLNSVTKTLKWIDDNDKSFNLTVEGYEVKKVLDADATDDETLTFNEVTKDDLGQYILVGNDDKLYSFINLYQQSDLVATTEKNNIYAAEGSSVKLSVDTKSTSTLTYTWKKGTKTLLDKSDKAEYTIDAVGEKTIGAYTCEVSDGVCVEKVDFNVKTIVASDGTDSADTIKFAKNSKDANVIRTDVFGAIQTGTKDFPNGQYTLTTSLPSGDYHYIWRVKNVAPTLDSSSILVYSSKNKNITFKNTTDMSGNTVTCYAVPDSVYDADKNIEDILKKIAKAANDYDKAILISTASTGLLALEDALVTSKGCAYKEEFNFAVAGTKEVKNEVKTVKMGDSITLEAPTVNVNAPTQKVNDYVWQKVMANGTTVSPYSNATNPRSNKLTIDNIDQFDLGVIKCTVNTWVDTDNDGIKDADEGTTPATASTMVKYYNLVCESDLTATAVDTQVKAGQDATLAVKATSTIPISYRWEYSNDKFVSDVNTVTPAPINGFTNELKVAGVTFPLTNTYRCVVTDGFKDVYVPVKLEEIETFKAYFDEAAQKDGTKIKDTDPGKNNTMTINALEGEKVTLSPIVVAASDTIEKDLTYTWTKNGLAYSTDKAITVEVGTTPVDYKLVITEGTAPLEIVYTVQAVDADDIKGYTTLDDFTINALDKAVYTGKEINPIKEIYYTKTGARYYLKEGTDYTVTLKDAINAGISVYSVELKGDFKDFYDTLTDAEKENNFPNVNNEVSDNFVGTFAIVRADNKVEIADSTVMAGQSVQPKTVTNLGKGALTYTYYADADATTEIAAPTKVGTYYVKATANATMNYNEATSNVAKVTVVPGKPKIGNTSRTASSITLNWAKTTGATAYRVYIKKNGKYTKVANTTGLKYTVTGLSSATTYQFAVKAFANGVASTVYSSRTTTTAPAKVSTLAVKAKGSRKVAISYSKVTRATGYQVYMAKGNGSYKKVAQGKLTAITKSKLTKGATYKFKVRAYKTVGDNTYYGAFSSAKAVKVK